MHTLLHFPCLTSILSHKHTYNDVGTRLSMGISENEGKWLMVLSWRRATSVHVVNIWPWYGAKANCVKVLCGNVKKEKGPLIFLLHFFFSFAHVPQFIRYG